MQDLVSIIVPVYNVAQCLDRCLNSLIGQTYPHIEVILVDDGSTDHSPELCDLWGARDSRIRVFHKPNGGLSDARNYGLQRAVGAYIGFLDSDDWYDSSFVEVMLQALTDTGSDIVECDFCRTHTEDSVPDRTIGEYQKETFEGRECFQQFLQTTFFVSACNKLYRREVIRDKLFRVGVYHEDEAWTYHMFSHARKVCRLHYTGYYYFQRPGSIVHTTPSLKRLTDAFDAGRERIDFIEEQYPEYAALGYSKMMYTCMYLFNETERADFPGKAALQRDLTTYFQSIWRKYLKKHQYRKEMWRFFLFSLSPKQYCARNY